MRVFQWELQHFQYHQLTICNLSKTPFRFFFACCHLHLVNVDFTYLPVLVQLGNVDGQVLAVVSVTATGCDTSGQPSSLDGAAPSAVSVQPSEVTGRPLGLSHRHLEVGRGAREVMSGDCDRE